MPLEISSWSMCKVAPGEVLFGGQAGCIEMRCAANSLVSNMAAIRRSVNLGHQTTIGLLFVQQVVRCRCSRISGCLCFLFLGGLVVNVL